MIGLFLVGCPKYIHIYNVTDIFSRTNLRCFTFFCTYSPMGSNAIHLFTKTKKSLQFFHIDREQVLSLDLSTDCILLHFSEKVTTSPEGKRKNSLDCLPSFQVSISDGNGI
ncbi:hypothetical protein ACH5RR_026935 [Cinchona calisaya]|uniref:Uncharacterized protein n=1 Tax=Cinchona calisaya TaxID=153742 RepID=A0ABD2Z905_9GENT